MIRGLLIFLFLTVAYGARCDESERKFNVLFIIADDLNDYVGCYGDPIVKTPNIDRLASRSVLFERAYCQFPVCGASRSSFMTGLRPDRTRIYDNGTHFRDTVPDVITLPQHFMKHGYFSARVGKIYHYGVPSKIGTDGRDDPASWDYKYNPIGRDKADEGITFSLIPGDFGGTLSWLSADGADEEQTDGIGATEAIRLLDEHGREDSPFFLAVGFYRPHTPFVAPHKYFNYYPEEQMDPPYVPEGDRNDMSPLAFFHKPDQDAMTPMLKRQARQAYAASISFMDAQVGRVLDALDRLGQTDNTVIVFTSDHGFHMGEHDYWQKEGLFEESARVPLLISYPGMKTAGERAAGICELIDIYPTLAELCGLPDPQDVDGESLVPQLVDPSASGKPFALTQAVRYKSRYVKEDYQMTRDVHGYSIRTEEFRFSSWDGGKLGEELYDLVKDPGEFKNVVSDPSYENHLLELRTLLKKEISESKNEI